MNNVSPPTGGNTRAWSMEATGGVSSKEPSLCQMALYLPPPSPLRLAVYTESRSAASELTTAAVSVAVGATAFKQLTPGVVSLGPALATAAAQQAAIASFPLGAGLGSLWYGVFPVTPSPLTTIGVSVGLALAFSLLSAFAGIVADPVQRRLGIHQRRLRRLVAAIERNLGGDGPERFVVRDHYVARILDIADLMRVALSKLH